MKKATIVALCLIWGLPIAAVGIFLLFTIIFIPVGMLLMALAGLPLGMYLRTSPKKVLEQWSKDYTDDPEIGDANTPWFDLPNDPKGS